MPCGYTKRKVKQAVVDDVTQKVQIFDSTLCDHLALARTTLNQLQQLEQESHCGDEEGVNDEQHVANVKQLLSDYENSEKELLKQRTNALGSQCTLIENIPFKKTRSSSYSSIDHRPLEEYLAERRIDLPPLLAVKQSNSTGNKIRHLERDIEESKSIITNSDSKIDGLKEENKRLKTTSLSQVSESKDSIVKTKSVESKNQPLKISNGKDAIREVHQQATARHNRNDSYSKMNEYDENNVKQYNRDHTIVNEEVGSRVVLKGTNKEANNYRENECIQREGDDGLAKKGKDIEGSKLEIERLNNDKKRLENDIKVYDQELANAREQNTNLKTQICQHQQAASRFESQLQSRLKDYKELQDKYHLMEEESRMLKSIESSKKKSYKATSDVKDIDIVKHENVTLQRKIEYLQNRIIELEGNLLRSQEDSENEKDKNKQLRQEKTAIEKEMHVIRRDLKAKDKEEKQLKDSLNQEKSVMIGLRQELVEVQRLLNVKEIELVEQKETSDNRISQMQLENQKKLLELSNTQRKSQKEASVSEAKLRQKLVDLEEDIKKKVAHNSELESQMQNLIKKNTNLETELQEERKNNTVYQEQIEQIKYQLEDADKNNQELKSNLLKAEENAKSKVEKLTKEVENLLKEKNKLTGKLTEIHKDVQNLQATLSSQKETFDANLSDLKQDKQVLTEDLADITNNMQDLQCQLLSQKEVMEEQVTDLKQNLNQSQILNSEIEKEFKSLQQEHLELKQMYDTAKDELDHLKSIQIMQIQLYHNSRVPLVSKVENELKSQLKQHLESSTTKIEFIDCEKVTDVDTSKPLLIVCICASRLGTDAATAIQNLKLTSKMALLVFHHKDGHALPNQASEHVLTGNEYKRLGGIFDFGFLSGKGMYSCELNDSNFKNIIHFINKEGPRCVGK